MSISTGKEKKKTRHLNTELTNNIYRGRKGKFVEVMALGERRSGKEGV